MTSETDNYKKLAAFFGKEYHALKAYVNSRIRASTNRNAEDILQDVALKLFEGADRFSPIHNVAGFVYHTIRNKIIDIMRTRKKMDKVENNEAKLLTYAETQYETTNETFSEQLFDDLKFQIMSLKPEYRDIIIAVDFKGFSYKEISMETGIPEGTLMSRRHRAISLLYKKMENIKRSIN